MIRPALRVLLALAVAVLAVGASSASAGSAAVTSIPVAGTSSGGGTFTGTMDVTGFAIQGGQVVALGTVSGTLTDASGTRVASVSDAPAAAVVQQQAASCTLVSLSIGPIDVEAVVVVVHVDPIALDVGLSGLLGNLLCGLLGGGAPA
jgi:hypothetical protein